jgi:hypothetical protein
VRRIRRVDARGAALSSPRPSARELRPWADAKSGRPGAASAKKLGICEFFLDLVAVALLTAGSRALGFPR